MFDDVVQILGSSLSNAFQAWRQYIQLRHDKRGMAFKALYYWANVKLRAGFNALRWVVMWIVVKKFLF